MIGEFGTEGIRCDLNQDGRVDYKDLFIFSQTWSTVNQGNPGWHWSENGNLEGWLAAKDLSQLAVADGLLLTSSTGTDPYLISPAGLTIDASIQKRVFVRMKVTTGEYAELFYKPEAGTFSSATKKRFSLNGNAEFATYTLDFDEDPNWTGTITQLRLDPTSASGASVLLDFVVVP